MTVGERIKKIRLEKGMTQKELADKCGIDSANLRKYEAGKQNPKLGTIEKIAEALNVPTTELITSITLKLPPGAGTKIFDFRDDTERAIGAKVSTLNNAGKQKVLDFVTDIAKIEEYTNP